MYLRGVIYPMGHVIFGPNHYYRCPLYQSSLLDFGKKMVEFWFQLKLFFGQILVLRCHTLANNILKNNVPITDCAQVTIILLAGKKFIISLKIDFGFQLKPLFYKFYQNITNLVLVLLK